MESLVSFVDTRVSVKTLYRADAERLWNALCAFSGDPDIASDAVSEAYAQLLHRGGAVANPVAWTWRAAFHIAGRRLSGPFDLLDGRYLGSGPDLGSWRPTAPP
jgi:DNA-directed RNA polymerase specialized sigma24 family protein